MTDANGRDDFGADHFKSTDYADYTDTTRQSLPGKQCDGLNQIVPVDRL